MLKEAIKAKELNPLQRVNSFQEVVLGYTPQEAVKEAKRCLQCKNPTCIEGCPIKIDIKKFIYHVAQGDFRSAYSIIRDKNDFPSICGRVCPAEYQCRKSCVLTPKDAPFASPSAINIHLLERFIGDYGIKNKLNLKHNSSRKLWPSKKVAIIGSGPAGLTCASTLAHYGVKVSVFESLHKIGGVLQYGIPSFRLPKDVIEKELNNLKRMGIKFITNYLVGKTITLEELFEKDFSAVFVATGAGTPSFLNIPGENLCNIYSANEFLTRVNLMGAHYFPNFHTPVNIGRKVVVIGGGNTALDAARCALRIQKMKGQKPNVTIIYRRTEKEMPARRIEYFHAQEEGIKFQFLTQPIKFIGNKRGYVKEVECLKCKLGPKDDQGRAKPILLENSNFKIKCDLVIIAIGFKPNKTFLQATPSIKLNKKGYIVVDPSTLQTSLKGVYAGGDIVKGEGTVIEAMGMGKKASQAILSYIS
ncbi:MAG: glutamate synthase (NADPH), homotetrameric [Candidatus Omnitrophota bacterium]|nr:MAG: glutamate synthase (NADPH), homotetrameric [Candidatus Omnitrophota bacterium]RKY45750.1 MAG: glutamate synthase (NADPH), homotetrameric [Candidatus Omnitrophota bacterium]HDN86642.1 NADPH-dependent glutamate synthase [Candidatus Omnitrophota bacterium]